MKQIHTITNLRRLVVNHVKNDGIYFIIQKRYWWIFWSETERTHVEIVAYWGGPLFNPLRHTINSNRYGSYDTETWWPGTFDLNKRVQEIKEGVINSIKIKNAIKLEIANQFK